MRGPRQSISSVFVSYCVVTAVLLLVINTTSPAVRDAAGMRTINTGHLGKYSVTGFDANLSGAETSSNTTLRVPMDPDARVLDASLRVTGSQRFLSKTIPGWGVAARNNENYGWAIEGHADFNGDGRPDFAVSAPAMQSGSRQAGRVDVYYGSTAGINAITDPNWSYSGSPGKGFGYALSHGDFNGDGIDDLVAGEFQLYNGTYTYDESIYLFYGSLSGLPSAPDLSVVSTNNTSLNGFGSALSDGVDINGDGYQDLVAGEPYYYTYEPPGCEPWVNCTLQQQTGRVSVLWGRPAGLSNSSMTTILRNTTSDYGFTVVALGDTDG